MKRWLLVVLVSAVTSPGVQADEPAQTARTGVCVSPDNRILGPRSDDRPLPLLAGSPAHGFRPACSVPWSVLSPNNQPLRIVGCFQGGLLQVANDVACGADTGPLWISARWVVTSADKQRTPARAATCQHLETGALAATRDFGCVQEKKDFAPKADPAQHVPADAAVPATAAPVTPHPSP